MIMENNPDNFLINKNPVSLSHRLYAKIIVIYI